MNAKSLTEKIKSSIKLSNLPLIIIALEILYIIYMNTVRCSAYPELDMAKLYRHAIEMSNHHSFFINGWNYITTMELDCSLLIAVPLYSILGNIYLSFGISNLIFLCVFLFVISDILRKINTPRIYKYFAVILLLIPYRVGMLEYFNMLFFNGSQYNIKILIPLIFIDLLLEDSSSLWNVKNSILFVLLCILMLVTSLSSGAYVLISGIFPIILAYLINSALDNNIKKFTLNRLIIIFSTVLSFAAGYVLCRIMNINPNSEAMDLISPKELIDNLFTTIWGYFCIFLPEKSLAVISKEGIIQLFRYGIAFIIIILLISNLKRIFKRGDRNNLVRLLTIPFIINLIILSLTRCCFSDVYYPERYFFIGLVPLILSVPIFLCNIEDAFPQALARKIIIHSLGLFVVLLTFICIYDARREINSGYEGGYNGVIEVISYAQDNGYNNILWLYNLPDGEVARMIAPNIKSSVINFTEDGTAFLDTARDFYYAANDAAYYEGSNILIEKIGSMDYDRLPEYIKNKYTFIGLVGGYNAYVCSYSPFDGISGFPTEDMSLSIDYMYTNGYTLNDGIINEIGHFSTAGNDSFVLLSPMLTSSNKDIDIIIKYNLDKVPANKMVTVNLLNENYECISQDMLSKEYDNRIITAPAGSSYYLSVSAPTGSQLSICEIDYISK